MVYPQSGWRIQIREIREGSRRNGKRLVLRLSGLGVFKVIAHRDFPLEKVKRIAVKVTRSGNVYVSFIVEDYEFPKLLNTGKGGGD